MLFATNRTFHEDPTPSSPDNNPDSRFPRPVRFNLKNNQVGQSIYFCRRDHGEQYSEIGHKGILLT